MNCNTNNNYKISILLIIIITFLSSPIYSESINNDQCLDCHDDYDSGLSFTAHSLTGVTTSINCVDCHQGGADHLEDPSTENISNPLLLTGPKAGEVCGKCHQPHKELDNFGFDSHSQQELNCSSCHKIHTSSPKQLLDKSGKFCIGCHSDTKAEFMRRSSHPVLQETLNCISCHSFSKKTDDNFSYDMNRVCQDCHFEEGGPHLFEHKAVESYSVEGSGCIECHNPHGSENDRLLRQPGNDLCNSCHFVPRHSTAHALANYEDYNCTYCHTSVHGSFDNSSLLDPDLPSKFGTNCFESGCHSRTR